MPFYEYQCSSCGHRHEELQKVSERPLRKCPDCGRNTLRRLMSAPAFRLKGGGWYETDFKRDQDTKRNLAGDKEPDKPAADKSETKPDAKPAEAPKTEATAKPDAAAKPESTKPAAAKPAARAKRARLRRPRPRP